MKSAKFGQKSRQRKAENLPELQPQKTIQVNQEQDKPMVDRKGMEESVMVRHEARKIVI